MSKNFGVQYANGFDENGNLTFDSYTVRGSDNAAAARTTAITNNTNLALAKQQNDWNIQQWERENEYNSPQAKIQRLKDAGLNPAFYDIDGVANASQLTSANLSNQVAPSLTPGSQTFSNYMSGISNGLNSVLEPLKLAVDTQKAKAEINKLNTASEVDRAQIDKIVADTGLSKEQVIKLQSDRQVNEANIKLANQKYNDLVASVGERKAHAYLMRVQTDYVRKEGDARIEKIQSDIGLNEVHAKELNQHIENMIIDAVKVGKENDLLDLEKFSKNIENFYKDRNMEADFIKNKADIIQSTFGYLTPIINIVEQTLGKGIVQTADQLNESKTDGSGNNQVKHFTQPNNTSTANPKL